MMLAICALWSILYVVGFAQPSHIFDTYLFEFRTVFTTLVRSLKLEIRNKKCPDHPDLSRKSFLEIDGPQCDAAVA
jgi:hypothetical protein